MPDVVESVNENIAVYITPKWSRRINGNSYYDYLKPPALLNIYTDI